MRLHGGVYIDDMKPENSVPSIFGTVRRSEVRLRGCIREAKGTVSIVLFRVIGLPVCSLTATPLSLSCEPIDVRFYTH
jgi:hypothetical protein